MSIPVSLRDLESAAADRDAGAYVLTVDDLGAPHVVRAEVLVADGGLIAAVGKRTALNAGRRSRVSLLYPARDSEDYSLIVDAVATVIAEPDGARLLLAPTRAVLHRPAPAADPAISPCGSDCVPLAIRAAR
ncbi:MAG TPA: pyridoxamine 5'-phosphate oxidase family protein [Candidatus Methylomirabilis sp.]|nr:pyridoxamine 5'-phosphate oxidase family protein [Candidatus Methylomirabilis sp.]